MKTSLWLSLGCLVIGSLLTGCGGGGSSSVSSLPIATSTPIQIAPPIGSVSVSLGSGISGLARPTFITNAGDGSNRLFVVLQSGQIYILKNGVVQSTPFLDVSSKVSCCGERGLLSIAFSSGYATKKVFYVNYTNTAGNTVVARYSLTTNPDQADINSEQILLTVTQPFANHNGGQLAFSPRDGYLYIGMGDGGSRGDPQNRAQNPAELLGKILRIDVENTGSQPYNIPATNPFVSANGYRPEIWALGVRNPWRFSFDRQTSDLWIADVGQDTFEEIDFQSAASRGGENYGWRIMEGSQCFNSNSCNQSGLTLPIFAYEHGSNNNIGCSITGGFVYRGMRFPQLQGLYLYGDFCSGRIWGLQQQNRTWQNQELLKTSLNISTFGEDEGGELYVGDSTNGTIYPLQYP